MNKGWLYVAGSMTLSGLLGIVIILLLSTTGPITAVALSVTFSIFYFFFTTLYSGELSKLFRVAYLKEILLAAFFIGIWFNGLNFLGLSLLQDPNMYSLFLLTQIMFTYIILGAWGKEEITTQKIIGTMLMGLGSLVLLYNGSLELSLGALILLLANISPAFGNYYQKKAKEKVSSNIILLFRSVISGVFLWIIVLFVEREELMNISYEALGLAAIIGVIFYGISKVFWLEAIHHLDITTVTSFLTTVPLITMIFSFLIFGMLPTIYQVISFFPIALGALLLIKPDILKNVRPKLFSK